MSNNRDTVDELIENFKEFQNSDLPFYKKFKDSEMKIDPWKLFWSVSWTLIVNALLLFFTLILLADYSSGNEVGLLILIFFYFRNQFSINAYNNSRMFFSTRAQIIDLTSHLKYEFSNHEVLDFKQGLIEFRRAFWLIAINQVGSLLGMIFAILSFF
jgi:hypothetical protein